MFVTVFVIKKNIEHFENILLIFYVYKNFVEVSQPYSFMNITYFASPKNNNDFHFCTCQLSYGYYKNKFPVGT